MPLLAALIANLFAALISFLVALFSKRIVLIVAAAAAVVSLTAAFVASVNSVIASVLPSLPDAVVAGATWILPSNTSSCIGAVVSTTALRWVYDQTVRLVLVKTQ